MVRGIAISPQTGAQRAANQATPMILIGMQMACLKIGQWVDRGVKSVARLPFTWERRGALHEQRVRINGSPNR
jgi:hypothetical protein